MNIHIYIYSYVCTHHVHFITDTLLTRYYTLYKHYINHQFHTPKEAIVELRFEFTESPCTKKITSLQKPETSEIN